MNFIVQHIKTQIAQYTDLFSLEKKDVSVKTYQNTIEIQGDEKVTGEYTLSGAVDGVASAGSLNRTFEFKDSFVETDTFFGNASSIHNLKMHKVNVGVAFSKESATTALNTNAGNAIIVYMLSCISETDIVKVNISSDMHTKVKYTIGVLFKVKAQEMSVLGCLNCDKLYIHSVMNSKDTQTTLVKFEQIAGRFYSQSDYIVDIEFSFIENIIMDDTFKANLKNWQSTFLGVDNA